ncbi:C40 family peptidase [Clostridium autoethanogenum]|uniref:C40 family peptidase n=1 Tax=Clostridium autoethanogenum DSM 10061 TaxID=1341692 RepID=A0ABM5NZF3_9CLOT|nr:C40 family peptidase [Clostridium autoethanogenum]AGY77993.1 C40 family peptidase [Clostridium autoethanogenum DSM 10061]ALU38127.1 NLP/P60 protein [Clostridium autoethanogenum DSM 10061]OVY50891.1 Gamma-D-glutamyl-L-lysine endopeptidase [Clostridium autoethanogenum]
MIGKWRFLTNYLVGYNFKDYVDVTSLCDNFSWSYDKDNIGGNLTFDSMMDFAEGRSHIALKVDDTTVFTGVVTQKQQDKGKGSYTVQDYSFFLNQDQIKVYQFNGEDAKSCIYKILTDNYIGGACMALSTKINNLYWGKKYIDIIKDILDKCKSETGDDIFAEIRGTVLWIDKISNIKKLDSSNCKYIMADDYNVTRNMENMCDYVIVSNNSTSTESNTDNATTSIETTVPPTILATKTDDNNIQIFGRMSKILQVNGQNEAQARTTAQNYLNAFDATNREVTVTLLDVENGENIRPNRQIYIDISRYGVKGYYKIKSAQHTLNGNVHKIQITVDFSGATFVDTTDYGTEKSTSGSSTSNGNNKADQIIAYAKQFLGVPYVWGGKTPSGFDCSGFVAYVFNHFGYNLAAYTYDMVNQGTRVSMNDIQPADIVFFFNTGHVGMYIGNDQFIQAPHTGDVVKISTFSGYYAQNCNAAIRVL